MNHNGFIETDRKTYQNRVFSYKYNVRKDKNYSRKDFSNSWNENVLFENVIFDQTNFDVAKIQNCSFINCQFKNLYVTKTVLISNRFKNCVFESVYFNNCFFQSNSFFENNYSNVFCYPGGLKTPRGLVCTEEYKKVTLTDELNIALDKALKNTSIRCSNTLYLKKSRRLKPSQKKDMNKINPKLAKKMGLNKNQRLEENRKRKMAKRQWQLKVHLEALEGKNRELSAQSLSVLVMIFKCETAARLTYASMSIEKPFKNISYLIEVMRKY